MVEKGDARHVETVLPRETLDAFDGDELRARVFYEKYTLRDFDGTPIEKTPQEMWDRLAREMAGVETSDEKKKEWHDKFYSVLEKYKFVPGGRIMFGAGQNRKVTLLNCYVIPVKSDSIDGIFQWCKEAAKTYSYSGGVGTDISVLRPRNAPVHNSAMYSTGAVSFMNIMSETTGVIGQAGRRGALMITISVDHPDVLEFIKVKRNLKNVRYANISIRITDEFMKAVEKDTDFTLRFENDSVKRIEKTIRARDLWNELVNSARDWAEPGLIFWDNVTRYSPSEYNGMNVISTNPCTTGETLVLTPSGWVRVDSLKVGDEITTAYGTSKPISEIYIHESQDVYRVKFTDGGEVNVTKGHIFHTREGRAGKDRYWNKFWNIEKRLSDIKVGDMVRVPKINIVPNNSIDTHGTPYKEYGFMVGALLGDGCYTPKVVARGHVKIASDFREKEWNDKIIRTFRHISENITITSSGRDNGCYIYLQKAGTQFLLNQTLLKPAFSFEKEIPTEYINSNIELHKGIIDGLVSTDGNINMDKTNPALRISSTSKKLLNGVRSILFFYGIHAKIYTTKATKSKVGDREIKGKHEASALYVYGADLAKFASIFDISHPEKQKRLDQLKDMSVGTSTDFSKIKSIEYVGKETVYDIYEEETDTWITNGYVSRGCSEQPLQAYGACDLGHVNLKEFVKSPFTSNAAVQWNELDKTIRYAVRFLDNVLTYNDKKHALQEQSDACRDSRRIGLGFTGLADMLVMLRIKYDSQESLEFIDSLMDRMKSVAYDESTEIAKEKGSFPLFDAQKHLSMPFIKERLGPELQEKIRKQGLRNVAILTIAPVGSGSVLAGTSSGIEPIFAFGYTRRSESLSKEFFKVYHPSVLEYMKMFNLNSDENLPEYFVPAHKIKADFRVKLQGIVQQHIDSAISSTVNLPENTTVEEVSAIYMQAWKAGCKGITVYREGSREGILITDEKEKENKTKREEEAWKRPSAMVGETVKFKMPDTTLYVTVNSVDGIVKEVFINIGKSGSEDKSYSEAVGRLISLYLQQGGTIQEVIKNLKGIQGNGVAWDNGVKLLSVPDAIAKAIDVATKGSQQKQLHVIGKEGKIAAEKTVDKDGNEGMEMCPKCQNETLVNENGCISCKTCGYSKCD